MTLWQAALIALFAYLGRKQTPWLCCVTGGWWGVGRPLVAGLICGIILGDVTSGVLCGLAVQAIYIGQITPGGALPSDVNLAAYIGIPLAMVSGGGADMAVALSIPLGAIGVALFNFLMMFNTVLPHYADKCAARGDAAGVRRANLTGSLFMFIERFPVVLLANFFGAAVVQEAFALLPVFVTDFLGVVGNLLPALGFAILLKQIVLEKWMISLFVLGWVFSSSFGLSTVALVFVAIALALIYAMARYGGIQGPSDSGSNAKEQVTYLPAFEDKDGSYEEV